MSLHDVVAATPRTPLAHLPTPLEPMHRLTAHLGGPNLWVKRDDLTGLGLGGNKVRKLEYVIPEAVAADADVLVSAGVAQSNSVRQIAAAAIRAGMDCHVVQMRQRVDTSEDDAPPTGNAMLIRLLGATIEPVRWTGDRIEALHAAAAALEARGRRPYVVPYGVSNPLGAIGYAAAGLEITEQCTSLGIQPDAVVHASGSGGTQAGLVVAFAGSATRVIGVDVDAEPDRVRGDVAQIAEALAAAVPVDPGIVAAALEVLGGYSGPHYGSLPESTVEAIDLGARLESLVLDPVYSAKALAALIGMVRDGRFDSAHDVIFIHTGGAPSLMAGTEVIERVEAHRNRRT